MSASHRPWWLPEGAEAGPRLATEMSRLLRAEFGREPDEAVPEGPHFVYDQNPTLFLGRRGRGPLRIAWDTNLLIDYFEHGRALWDGVVLPDAVGAEYGEELEGLQLVVAVWVLRDIRFVIPKRALSDGKRRLTAERQAQRERAFDAFAAALALVEWSDDLRSTSGPATLDDALDELPRGADRELVKESVLAGAHVFMTRDAGVLRAREALAPHGLLLASPLDVLEELAASGALHCLLEPRCAYWPVPDLQRVTHLLKALPGNMADHPLLDLTEGDDVLTALRAVDEGSLYFTP